MTWNTLQASAVSFGAEQMHLQKMFASGQYAGDTWEELYMAEAKNEIERDFRRVLRLDVGTASELASIDTLVDTNTADFRDLLAVKQLVICFTAIDAGPDSMNRLKRDEYSRRYQELLQRLPALYKADGTAQAGSYRIRI